MTMLTRRTWAIFATIFALGLARAGAQTVSEELRRADRQFGLYAYNLALKSYQTVIEKDPDNAHALARLADCYVQLNRPDEALQWYDRALAHNDAKPIVMLHYGQALMSVGNYAGAKKWFVFYANHSQEEGEHFSKMCDYALENAEKEALYAASNESANTAAADFLPTFLGERIVLSSARADLARSKKGAESVDWAGSAYNQLFVTQRDAKGNLQKPAFLKNDLANTYNEGPVSFSADGKRVAFCRNNFVDGSRQIAESGVSMSLYIAEVADGHQWVNVKAFPYNGSDYATGYPSLSADGNTLFFASNQPEGEGGWDIYASNWTGKYWTQPTNLGKTVNSKGNEITPFFDGKNLYFASDWHLGFGGLDVFRAEKEDSRWAKIFHLGPGINSSRDDYGFVFNAAENIGYFTSNRAQGKGNEDIWRVRKKTDDFVLTVLDAVMMPIAGAEVDFSACKGGTFTTDADGKCAFSAPAGQLNCTATIRKTGFREANVEVKSAEGARQFSVALTSIKPAFEPAAARRDEPLAASTDKAPMIFSDVKPQVYSTSAGASSPKKAVPAEVETVPKTLELEPEATEAALKARGFSVQIAALQGDATPAKLAKYDNVKSFGNLYVQQNDFEAKVRLGVFETREAAAVALQKVEALGYRKPFVVEEKSADGKLMIYQNPPKTAKVAAKSPEPVAYSYKSSARPAETEERFAVQVASLSNDESYSLDPFAKLSDVGKVYSMPTGGAVKIRVGVWRERAEAEAARRQIVRRGFADAMLVEEKASPMVDRYLQENDAPTAAAPAQYSTKTVQSSAPKSPQTSPYKVRVATYEEAYNFNLDKLEGVDGKLETRKSGKNTIFLLAGYPSLEAALRAKNAVRERGFRDAHVVKEEDGELVKLKL